MRHFWALVLIVEGLMLTGFAHAAAPLYTTAYLRHLCTSTYDIDVGLCAGYVMGVADGLQQSGAACLSPMITPEVLIDNLNRGWAAQTGSPPDEALHSVQDILQTRFPCR